MVNNRRANDLEEEPRRLTGGVFSSIPESIMFPVASAGEQKTDYRADANSNGDRLIRMFVNRFVGCFGPRHGFIANAAADFFGPF